MDKQGIALIVIGSLLSSDAAGKVDKSRPHWLTSDHKEVRVRYTPAPFGGGTPEQREPIHPAEGERAGHTLFTGIASGAISNVVANTMEYTATSFSVEPSSDGRSGFDFEKTRTNVRLKVSAPVKWQRRVSPFRARSNC
jgi:hypothetical protein